VKRFFQKDDNITCFYTSSSICTYGKTMSRKLMFSLYSSLAVRQAAMTNAPSLTSALSLVRESRIFKKERRREKGKRNRHTCISAGQDHILNLVFIKLKKI